MFSDPVFILVLFSILIVIAIQIFRTLWNTINPNSSPDLGITPDYKEIVKNVIPRLTTSQKNDLKKQLEDIKHESTGSDLTMKRIVELTEKPPLEGTELSKHISNHILFLRKRHNRLHEDNIKGIIDYNKNTNEQNKITADLVHLIDQTIDGLS